MLKLSRFFWREREGQGTLKFCTAGRGQLLILCSSQKKELPSLNFHSEINHLNLCNGLLKPKVQLIYIIVQTVYYN